MMVRLIYGLLTGMYPDGMRARRTGNVDLRCQLSATDEKIVRSLRERLGVRHLSKVIERVVLAFLERPDLGRGVLPLPTRGAGPLLNRNYRISPETLEALTVAAETHHFRMQEIVRAAIHAFRPGEPDQDPTQTGR